MKKIKILCLLFFVVFSFAACSTDNNNNNNTDNVPTAPQNFTVTATNAQAVLSWTAPISNGGAEITKYQVSSGAAWTDASANTTHTFTGLINDTEYTFKVRAVNSAGPGAEAMMKATPSNPQTNNHTQYTLDRIILGTTVYSPDNSLVAGVRDVYGTTVKLYEDNTITFSGTVTGAFGRNSYSVNNNGDVTISGITDTFNQTTYQPGHFSFGFSSAGVSYSFNYYNDEIWFEHADTYTLSFQNTGDYPIDPVQRKERELLNAPIPTRKGYTFNRWSDSGLQWPTVLNRMPGSNHTLSASWDFHFTTRLENNMGRNTISLTGISTHGLSQTSIYIPDTYNNYPIEVIDADVFRNNTNIEHLSIGANISYLNSVYMFQGMTSLESITLRSPSYKTPISDQTLGQIGNDVLFYVPANLVSNYKSDSTWSRVADRIFAIE